MNTIIEMLIISAFCVGLDQLTQEGRLGHPLFLWLEKRVNPWLFSPLLGCVYCMASLWGTIIYWSLEYAFFGMFTTATWICWPIVCVGCVFLNGYLHESLFSLQKDNSKD